MGGPRLAKLRCDPRARSYRRSGADKVGQLLACQSLSSAPDPLDAKRIEDLMAIRFPQIHLGRPQLRHRGGRDRGARGCACRPIPATPGPAAPSPGAAMFTLADFSIYVAIIGTLGEVGFEAVTASLTINFLAKPEARRPDGAREAHPARAAPGGRRGRNLFGRACRTWLPTPSPTTRSQRGDKMR